MIGKLVSHYRILEKLGEGGMGVVYKAEDTKLKRTVALKFLSTTALASEAEKIRFMHEAQAAAVLDHPNVCTVYEIDEAENQTFIAMAYIDGQSLKEKIEANLPKVQNLREVLDYATQIAEGLQAAHEKGIIHRDIKPANVMLTEKGQVKIMDFGLAKLAGATMLTIEGTTMGTVAYMSPEQTQGDEVDHRTDIWTLGAVIYEMVSGKQPFAGDYEQAVMYSIVNEEPQPLTGLRTGVPIELERVILKALAKAPDERYQNLTDLLVDLKNLQKVLERQKETKSTSSTVSTAARTVEQTPASKTLKSTKRFSATRFIAGGAIAVLLLAAVIFVSKPLFQPEPVVSGPRPVVVMPFENQTGDPSLDYLRAAIPNLLITNLEQSKYLTVLTWERMQDLLKQMGRDSIRVVNIDWQTGFELSRLDDVHGIVLGSFTRAGEVFATDIKVLDVASKRTLKSANARGKGVGSILEKQIDALTKEISRVVIELPEQAEKEELRIADVTTSSMEAYRYYLEGVKYSEEFLWQLEEERLQQALALDSSFAMAHYYLAKMYNRTGKTKAAHAAFEKARESAARATYRESLYIRMDYTQTIENDLETATLALTRNWCNNFQKKKPLS